MPCVNTKGVTYLVISFSIVFCMCQWFWWIRDEVSTVGKPEPNYYKDVNILIDCWSHTHRAQCLLCWPPAIVCTHSMHLIVWYLLSWLISKSHQLEPWLNLRFKQKAWRKKTQFQWFLYFAHFTWGSNMCVNKTRRYLNMD